MGTFRTHSGFLIYQVTIELIAWYQRRGIRSSFHNIGLLDGFSFLTRSILLLVFIVKPSQKPKLAYMLSAIILIVLFLAVPGSPYLGDWGYPVLLVAMILSGFSRAFNFVPMVIINSEFDATGEDSFKL